MELFGAAHKCGGVQKDLLFLYPTLMKLSTVILSLKKINKTHKPCDTPIEFC